MAVNPTVAAIAEQMSQAYGDRAMTDRSVAELRAMTDAMIPPSQVTVASVVETTVAAGERGVPVRVYRPEDATGSGVLLWLHGGGFVLGGLELGDDLSRRLCVALGVSVVNVDYATAPEHPFPAALEDSAAVLAWIRSGPVELAGADVSTVAVAGDSAGGNLATVLALRCRNEGAPLPACVVSVYGTAECVVTNPELGDLVFLTGEDAQWFWGAYTDQPDHPYVAPARADSLAGFPPLFCVTAEHDPTRDGTERFAARAADEGVDASWKRYPGVHHGFFGMVDILDESRAAFEDTVTFLGRHLNPAPVGSVQAGGDA